MNNKEITKMQILELPFTTIENVIKINLQEVDHANIQKIIDFNRQNDNNYLLWDDTGMLCSETLLTYLRKGYKIRQYDTTRKGIVLYYEKCE